MHKPKPKMYDPRLILCIIIFLTTSRLLLGKSSSCPPPKPHPLAPALYIFGDSFVDNGNNLWLITAAKANYAPYGDDFPCPVLPGRYTNGRTPADFIAEYLGLPYPPPFTSLFKQNVVRLPNFSNSKLSEGYNYASSMCGILRETGSIGGKCYSFDEQIEMFRSTVDSQLTPMFKDPTELSRHLTKSIFFISVGNNDYLGKYLFRLQKQYDSSQYAQLLVDTISQQLQRLYNLGARKVVMTGVCSIGCIPTMVRNPWKKNQGMCDDESNNAAAIYNKELELMLRNLTYTLQGAHFIIVRTYDVNYDVVNNPAKYGFRDSSNPCCTTWWNGTFPCLADVKPCSDPDKHYFWDGFHPTEAAYSYLTKQCINGSSVCIPMNLEQLVQL